MNEQRVQPQNIDAEKAVLGAILLERDAFERVTQFLTPDSFYHQRHETIFEAMCELKATGASLDSVSVLNLLKAKEQLEQIGGAYEITSLTNHYVSFHHTETHCKIIAEKKIRRDMIKVGMDFINSGYDEEMDTFDAVADAEKSIFQLTNTFSKGNIHRIEKSLIESMKRIESMRNRTHQVVGVPSCYRELDRITCGWQETNLIILAARPACGKTAFSLNLAYHAAAGMDGNAPVPVGIFNLEMSASQLSDRVLANASDTPLNLIRDARLDDAGMERLFTRGIKKVAGMDIYVDDTASLNVYEFKAKARRMVEKHKVKLIILDYLQLMKPAGGNKNQNREQEISTISRELKITAKELKVPIIALSQLSREVERRGGAPKLSDLRESGAIEQDADMVMFLWGHPEASILQDPSLKEEIFLKIAKHRNGDLADFSYQFIGSFQRFVEKGIASSAYAEAAPF